MRWRRYIGGCESEILQLKNSYENGAMSQLSETAPLASEDSSSLETCPVSPFLVIPLIISFAG